MREHQLAVDLSIEQHYKKIESYAKPLKILFDMGTHLLASYKTFYEKWYNFQISLQTKLYNNLYTETQDLNLSNFKGQEVQSVV